MVSPAEVTSVPSPDLLTSETRSAHPWLVIGSEVVPARCRLWAGRPDVVTPHAAGVLGAE